MANKEKMEEYLKSHLKDLEASFEKAPEGSVIQAILLKAVKTVSEVLGLCGPMSYNDKLILAKRINWLFDLSVFRPHEHVKDFKDTLTNSQCISVNVNAYGSCRGIEYSTLHNKAIAKWAALPENAPAVVKEILEVIKKENDETRANQKPVQGHNV